MIDLNLSLFIKTRKKPKIDLDKIQQKTLELLYKKKISGKVELDLVLVGEKKIRSLNYKYLGKNQVTDVLSFPVDRLGAFGKSLPYLLLGDIFICLPQAIKQAKRYNHSLEKEIEILFLHGLKHLLGTRL